MQKLISELKRLYVIEGQQYHDQDKSGESYFPAGPLSAAILAEHLEGTKTVALNLVSEAGMARAMVIDFDGVAHGKGKQHWEALASLAKEANSLDSLSSKLRRACLTTSLNDTYSPAVIKASASAFSLAGREMLIVGMPLVYIIHTIMQHYSYKIT